MPMGQEFHPDLRRIARVLPGGPYTRRTLPVIRALTRLQALRFSKYGEVAALPSGINVRLPRPQHTDNAGAALLWIHGGGYVIGSAAQDDALCRRFARELGAVVASVDYRLAPENPYPAALALLTRDRGEIPLAAQLLVYPMLDDRTVGRHLDNPGLRLWNQSSNKFGWSSYLGGADPEVAVPARREDLSGLPPAWLGVGTFDLFHDEDLAYAERLKAAGVPCEGEVVPGAFHGFDGIVPKAHVSQSFFNSQ